MRAKNLDVVPTPTPSEPCCPPRPALKDRPLIAFVDAVKVMALFKVLANDTRIRLLHQLVRSEEASVTALAKTLGMKPQAISNQLQRLSDTGVVASRRDGNNIYYRITDRCLPVLLDQALCIMEDESNLRASARGE
jgi:DNA-binding transcriptional ArsR family regulator